MTNSIRIPITDRRRANLTKLADYLESLPEDYQHFDMEKFFDHYGECNLASGIDQAVVEAAALAHTDVFAPEALEQTLFATSPDRFLNNCGTVACALGHGPAAGIPLAKSHIATKRIKGQTIVTGIDFESYCKLFTRGETQPEWDFLFSGDWKGVDDHHWGAAARIRYLLDNESVPGHYDFLWGTWELIVYAELVDLYRPYRVDVRCATSA